MGKKKSRNYKAAKSKSHNLDACKKNTFQIMAYPSQDGQDYGKKKSRNF